MCSSGGRQIIGLGGRLQQGRPHHYGAPSSLQPAPRALTFSGVSYVRTWPKTMSGHGRKRCTASGLRHGFASDTATCRAARSPPPVAGDWQRDEALSTTNRTSALGSRAPGTAAVLYSHHMMDGIGEHRLSDITPLSAEIVLVALNLSRGRRSRRSRTLVSAARASVKVSCLVRLAGGRASSWGSNDGAPSAIPSSSTALSMLLPRLHPPQAASLLVCTAKERGGRIGQHPHRYRALEVGRRSTWARLH
jgi:hypothetical protein